MYIKNIELDGFKSYAKRTEIQDFDNLFNAITGLNGSGKSNILDSICFLLGIQQLSQVRASNLTELVYKNGQAGVIRATVSITFDNSDKENSPIGYVTYDEIVVTRQINIGGKNKYLINGVMVQNNKVADFFQSVGLNINNPHFLIMQGRVTKVMNMKPMEILSMIEEATGTRMYESKRENCSKLVQKKNLKWMEITNILEEELEPKINRLKEDREAYLEYQQLGRLIEQNEKVVIAFKYNQVDRKLSGADEREKFLREEESNKTKEKETTENEIKEINQLISEMKEQNESERGEKMKELEAQLSGHQSEFAKLQAGKKAEQDKLKQHQKQVDSKKKEIEKKTKLIEKKTEDRNQLAESHEANQKAATETEEDFNKAETMLEQLRVGTAMDGSGGATTIAQEAMNKRQIVSEKETEMKTSKSKLKKTQSDLSSLKKKMSKSSKDHQNDVSQLNKFKAEKARVEDQLEKLEYDESHRNVLVTRMNELDELQRDFGDQQYAFYQHFPSLDVDQLLRLPNNFDRRKIKGMVADLIQVTNMDYVGAIEKCAGGKLYNLVVDSSATAQYLLKHKCLKRRITMIPMDKIRATRELDPRKISLGKQRVGGQNCFAIRNLVRPVAPEFNEVANFCFNGVMTARTRDQAHDLCFQRDIHCKVISAGGDVFSPDGVLSGGRKQNRFVLKEILQLEKIKEKLSGITVDRERVKSELDQMEKSASEFAKLDKHRNQVSAKLDQIQNRVSQSEFGQLQAEHDRLEDESTKLSKFLDEALEIYTKAKEEAEAIEERMKNLEQNRDKELKRLQKEVDSKRKIMEKAASMVDQHQANFEGLRLEIQALEEEVKATREELQGFESETSEISSQLEAHIKTCNEGQSKIDEVKSLIQEQRQLIQSRDQEINEKKNREKDLHKKIKELDSHIYAAKRKIETHLAENKEDLKYRRHLEEKYTWIELDKAIFGQKNSAYDFEQKNPQKAEKELQKAKSKKEKLNGQINQRAMALLQQAEKAQEELFQKREGVETDRDKLTMTIERLDNEKKQEITRAYKEVNKNFASIFASLLPGATAKLQPPEGKTVLEGLEFKVGFGNVWKDNLSELSGGQRSLVALSLILAMLLLKPAPIYILDEVDAALDLSHTQNIGSMLKTHFQKSQFIVVSLKDGMFENANVLYRTKFVDGVSTVSRIASNNRRKANDSNKENVPYNKRKNKA